MNARTLAAGLQRMINHGTPASVALPGVQLVRATGADGHLVVTMRDGTEYAIAVVQPCRAWCATEEETQRASAEELERLLAGESNAES